MDRVRAFRAWAGNPSYRAMAAMYRVDRAHTTLYAALRRDDLPDLNVLLDIIKGCGGDVSDENRFANAWRRLTMPRTPARLAVAS